MNAREQGFLLLTDFLGDPDRKPLTIPQMRTLAHRAQRMKKPLSDRDITVHDLTQIGCSTEDATRILSLLSCHEQLMQYLQKGKLQDCIPVTRISADYPRALRKKLGEDCPVSLWTKGDLSILDRPMIALVGSRELNAENSRFAAEVGKQAALKGYVLVSGNARGADRIAQNSCIEHGGCVVSVVADALYKYPLRRNTLFISENGFDLPFSAHRALHRNHIIHCLAETVFVAQCSLGKGGTWSGATANLQHKWTPVYCYNDHSSAVKQLIRRGALSIRTDDLCASEYTFPTD